MLRKVAFSFAVLVMAAVVARADAVSYLDFGKGPAQWIMTADEQRAWRKVRTEDQARDFVDLFWARRDPTPGTPRNEFRLEFEERVAYADKNFKEEGRRGSLTERGRVLAVLGFATNMRAATKEYLAQRAEPLDAEDPTGGRQMAGREFWIWEHKDAEKFGMPRIEVLFVFDGFMQRARRDPQRTDFTSALPTAIKSYIKSPDLTVVPDWASSRNEKSVVIPAEAVVTETSTTTTVTRTVVDRPAPVARAAGAGKLTLLYDVTELQPQSGADPFASLASAGSFKRDEELGWTAEYCAGAISADAPSLEVRLRITGTAAGRPVSLSSEPEQFVPDSIKASPGCYLLRGSLPLADVEPGSYTLTVTIAGSREEQRYNLTREFRVE